MEIVIALNGNEWENLNNRLVIEVKTGEAQASPPRADRLMAEMLKTRLAELMRMGGRYTVRKILGNHGAITVDELDPAYYEECYAQAVDECLKAEERKGEEHYDN